MKIVRSWETNKIRKLVASPSYARHEVFGNDLAGMRMYKLWLFLDKLIYTGMTILENSKILMNDFFYNEVKVCYREKDLPEGLFNEPQLGSFFRDICSVC